MCSVLLNIEAPNFPLHGEVVLSRLREQRIEQLVEIYLLAIEIIVDQQCKEKLSSDYLLLKKFLVDVPDSIDTPITDSFVCNARQHIRKHINREFGFDDQTLVLEFCGINRILAGYSLAFGLEGAFRCRFENERLILPHVGVDLRVDSSNGECILNLKQGELFVDGIPILISDANAAMRHFPYVEFGDRKVFLNREEKAFANWIEGQPFHQSITTCFAMSESTPIWIKRLRSARFLLKKFWPEIESQFSRLITDIVPLGSPEGEGESLSCSSSGLVGAIASSIVPSEEFGEMLVHEYAHNLLNASMRFESFFTSEGLTENKYYSPFRSDLRPISGVFHAMHSLLYIANYYSRLGEDARYREEFSEVFTSSIIKIRICYRVVKSSSCLTEIGDRFADLIANKIQALTASPMWHPTKFILDEHERHLASVDLKNCVLSWKGDASLSDIVLTQIDATKFNHPAVEVAIKYKEMLVEYSPAKSSRKLVFSDDINQCPIVWKGLQIFDEEFLTASNLLNNFGSEIVTILDISKHKGYTNTPKKQVTLKEYLSLHNENKHSDEYYLGVQQINHWHGVNSAIREKALLNRFFLDNDELLFFKNKLGTVVLMHQDSSNNLHFNLWGRKTFFLCHPNQAQFLYEHELGYREGFSPVNPFDVEETEKKFQDFSRVNGMYVTLEAGDCLYLPKNWWHAVQYLDDCASVTCWDRYSQ
jgi:HEXXH motif-containing protein